MGEAIEIFTGGRKLDRQIFCVHIKLIHFVIVINLNVTADVDGQILNQFCRKAILDLLALIRAAIGVELTIEADGAAPRLH